MNTAPILSLRKQCVLAAIFFMMSSWTLVRAQELYPIAEAASNGPKDVLRLRVMSMIEPVFQEAMWSAKAMYSLDNALMLTATVNASSYLAGKFPAEFRITVPEFRSAALYGKYRFYVDDAPHYHVRLAAFAEYDYAPKGATFRSFTGGVKDGASAGVIGTWLRNRTALSATLGYFLPNDVLFNRGLSAGMPGGIGLYSLSAGHLVLPVRYTSYDQVNLNVYCELLGFIYTPTIAYLAHPDSAHTAAPVQYTKQETFHRLDIAPAVQLIFDSRAKLDAVFRMPLVDMSHTFPHWMVTLAFEYYFF